MRITRPLSRGVLAALAVTVVLIVVGVVVIATSLTGSRHENINAGAGRLPKAALDVAHLRNGKLPYGKRLRMQVANGALSSVVVRKAGGGQVAGAFNQNRTRWHSADVLAPSLRLHATVAYADLAHKTTSQSVKIRTPAAKHHFTAELSPGGGATVGIAAPISVTFDRPIPNNRRAAVESGLSVTTTPAVVGAWHWMSDQVVHWRPPSYWKTGTKVTVASNLQGVNLGHNVYGAVGRHHTSFKIGAAHISEVNQATHEMQVYNNGKLIKTFPVSTGRQVYPTMDGIHIALEKSSVVQMDSATVGIPKGSPGYYNETVYWDVRISNGGEFVHAAPWSVGSQGHANVSHGCVNLSTSNAEWFYNWARNGDVVDVYNGVRPPESGDAGTADWNMSWKKWLAGDAAPSAAAKALHPREPRTYEPNFRPKKAHHHSHHSSAKHHSTRHAKHAAKHSSGSSW